MQASFVYALHDHFENYSSLEKQKTSLWNSDYPHNEYLSLPMSRAKYTESHHPWLLSLFCAEA